MLEELDDEARGEGVVAKPAVTLVLVIMFAAACDDSGDDGDASAPRVLSPEVARLNNLCSRANAPVEAEDRKRAVLGTFDEHQRLVDLNDRAVERHARFVRE